MALVLTAFCWMPGAAAAQGSQPDPAFGTAGKVTTTFSDLDQSAAIVVQPDGKLVVVGRAAMAGAPDTGDFAIARYHANGSLDGSFGTGGRVTTDFYGFSDGAEAVALQSDGKIVVVGFASGAAALARYTVNGSLDTEFGTGGKAVITQGRFYWRPLFFDPHGGPPPPCPRVDTVRVTGARSIAIQPDGKIVIGAIAGNPSFEPEYIAIARYNASGTPDTTFITPAEKRLDIPSVDCPVVADGVVITGNEREPGLSELFMPSVFGIALQPDGGIIAAANGQTTSGELALVKYLPTGALDQTFGTAGVVHESALGLQGYAMALQPDGKIVIAGSVWWNDRNVYRDAIVLKRYNSDGSLDVPFGYPGFDPPGTSRMFVPNASVGASAVTLDSAGRILVAGCLMPGGRYFYECRLGPGSAADFLIARFSSSGQLDLSFAPGGWLDQVYGYVLSLRLIDFAGFRDWATGIALQPDGGIVAVGAASPDGTQTDFALVRLVAPDSHTVTPSVVGSGAITPNTPSVVVEGESATFTLTPAAGNAIAGISGTCGGTRTGNVFVTAPVTADCTVIASFAPLSTSYTVTPSAGPNGVINPGTPRLVNSGATTAFTLVPNTGFRVATVGGTCGGSLNGSVFTTAAVTANCTVNATFSALPTLALDRTSLNAGATSTGSAFVARTSGQAVRLVQSGTGTVSWTVTPSQPWLQVTPSSGVGPAVLTVTVAYHPTVPVSGSVTGSINFTVTGAANTPGPITVRLTVRPHGSSAAPTGIIDTPVNNAMGVAGSLAVTGWAVDDVEVVRVRILRGPLAGEGSNLIFIGNAVRVEGARPDIPPHFPTTPRNTMAGWGYLMLTNFLPGQGNGTFVIYAIADDAEGQSVVLGSKTITCTNATSLAPFGAIDTPSQGEVVSGTVNNFGWVLAPGTARADVPGGGSVSVFIDGVPVGVPYGWSPRADITAAFPSGFSSLGSAVALHVLDSTTIPDGVHTIAWGVTANNGQGAGVGSRYFTVLNGTGTSTSSAAVQSMVTARSATDAGSVGIDWAPVRVRRGFDEAQPFRVLQPDGAGRLAIDSEELDRIEVQMPGAGYSGYLKVPGGVAPLPTGSLLDGATGQFTWQPGVGFLGTYDFVFVRCHEQACVRREMRVRLWPQGSGRLGPQVMIDLPSARQELSGPFVLAGWAIDTHDSGGTGVDTVHAWAYPRTGDPTPIFLGVAALGGARPDVAAVYGERFAQSGYGLTVTGLAPGDYDVAVFAWSRVTLEFAPARTVHVVVR